MSLDGERPMRFMVPSVAECPDCAGLGVTWYDCDNYDVHTTVEEKCTSCDGSGEVHDDKESA